MIRLILSRSMAGSMTDVGLPLRPPVVNVVLVLMLMLVLTLELVLVLKLVLMLMLVLMLACVCVLRAPKPSLPTIGFDDS